MSGTLHTDKTVLAEVRRWYRGEGLGEADCAQMAVEAIAERFDVHPNSVHLWAVRFEWQRPAWYRQTRRRGPNGNPQAHRYQLLDLLRQHVGLACPSDGHLAKAIDCSGVTVAKRLRELRQEGALTVEISGCCRRFVLKDGLATGWTARKRAAHLTMARVGLARATSMPVLAKQRRQAELLKILHDAALKGAPCPDNVALGLVLKCAANTPPALIGDLVAAGHFTIERTSNARRITFPDGASTSWPRPAGCGPAVVDVGVSQATIALQRRGKVTFDCAVYGGEWGRRWCVDGRILARDQLLAEARQ